MDETYMRKSDVPAHKSSGSRREQTLGSCTALNSAFLAKCQKLDGQPVDLMDQHRRLNIKWGTKRVSMQQQAINNPTADITNAKVSVKLPWKKIKITLSHQKRREQLWLKLNKN